MEFATATYKDQILTIEDALTYAAFVKEHDHGPCGSCREDAKHWQNYRQQILAEEALLILASAVQEFKKVRK